MNFEPIRATLIVFSVIPFRGYAASIVSTPR